MAFHWLLDPFWAQRGSRVRKTCSSGRRNELTEWIHDWQVRMKCYFYSNLIIYSFYFWPSFFKKSFYGNGLNNFYSGMVLYHGTTEPSHLSNWIKNLMPIFVLKFHGHPLSLDQKHLNKLNVNFQKTALKF